MNHEFDVVAGRALRGQIAELERDRFESYERARTLERLLDAFADIARARSPNDAIALMLRATWEPLGFTRAYYFAVDRERGLEATFTIDGSDAVEPSNERPDLRPGSALLAVLRGDRSGESGRAGDLCAPLADVRRWYVMSALQRGETALGVLYADGHRSREPLARESRLVRALATIAAVTIDNTTLFSKTRELAERDPLTGLLNRRALATRLAAELERVGAGASFAYVIVDVDDFKDINDRQGHARGDEVLKHIAATLARVSRAQDVVGRFAGDEFVVILTEADRAVAQTLVARLWRELERSDLRCSLGAAICPLDARDADALFLAADRALYATKAAGKNGFSFADGRLGSDGYRPSAAAPSP